MAEVVADASALVDLLLDNALGQSVRRRLAGLALHATLRALAAAPIERHPVNDLLPGA